MSHSGNDSDITYVSDYEYITDSSSSKTDISSGHFEKHKTLNAEKKSLKDNQNYDSKSSKDVKGSASSKDTKNTKASSKVSQNLTDSSATDSSSASNKLKSSKNKNIAKSKNDHKDSKGSKSKNNSEQKRTTHKESTQKNSTHKPSSHKNVESTSKTKQNSKTTNHDVKKTHKQKSKKNRSYSYSDESSKSPKSNNHNNHEPVKKSKKYLLVPSNYSEQELKLVGGTPVPQFKKKIVLEEFKNDSTNKTKNGNNYNNDTKMAVLKPLTIEEESLPQLDETNHNDEQKNIPDTQQSDLSQIKQPSNEPPQIEQTRNDVQQINSQQVAGNNKSQDDDNDYSYYSESYYSEDSDYSYYSDDHVDLDELAKKLIAQNYNYETLNHHYNSCTAKISRKNMTKEQEHYLDIVYDEMQKRLSANRKK